MNPTNQFAYAIENLSFATPSMMQSIIAIIASIIFLIVCRYVLLYHAGFFIVWHESRVLASKKHILGDLILMKDIQTEMEKDLEQASLKATFQS